MASQADIRRANQDMKAKFTKVTDAYKVYEKIMKELKESIKNDKVEIVKECFGNVVNNDEAKQNDRIISHAVSGMKVGDIMKATASNKDMISVYNAMAKTKKALNDVKAEYDEFDKLFNANRRKFGDVNIDAPFYKCEKVIGDAIQRLKTEVFYALGQFCFKEDRSLKDVYYLLMAKMGCPHNKMLWEHIMLNINKFVKVVHDYVSGWSQTYHRAQRMAFDVCHPDRPDKTADLLLGGIISDLSEWSDESLSSYFNIDKQDIDTLKKVYVCDLAVRKHENKRRRLD